MKIEGFYLKINKDKPSVEQISEAEAQIKGAPVEIAVCFDEKTGFVFAKAGEEDSVSFSDEELADLPKRILTHNHPSGSAVSVADVVFAATHRLAQIRTVTQAVIYVIAQPEGNWNFEAINEIVDRKRDYLRAMRLNVGRRIYDDWVDGHIEKADCAPRYARAMGEIYLGFIAEELGLAIQTLPAP